MRRVPLALATLLLGVSSAFCGEVDLPRYPSISPDGETIVFSWHGDLWSVAASGGEARRLTNHAGLDTHSAWSPDGRTIAFASNRSGSWNLHVMAADGSGQRQVTNEDESCSLAGFSADGSSLLFASSREDDVYREPRPFRVAVAGGPVRRVHDAHGRFPRENAFVAGKLLFTRGGSSWSRRHYRGPASRDVWLLDQGTFRRLTTWEGNDGRARWLTTRRIVFLSDRELDTVNLWEMDEGGDATARRLTSFAGRDVQAFDVAAGTGRIVLHVWDRLYVVDPNAPDAAPRPLAITAPDDPAAETFVVDASSKVSEARLSPDGKVLAVVAHGDVFVRAVEDDAPTRRVTFDTARKKDIAWSPDGMRLYFVSDADGTDSIYAATVARTRKEIVEAFESATRPEEPEAPGDETGKAAPGDEAPAAAAPDQAPAPGEPDGEAKEGAGKSDGDAKSGEKKDAPGPERWQDAVAFTIAPVLAAGTDDREPTPSPDGRRLAFRRGLGSLCVLDLQPADPDLLDVTVESPGWDLGSFRWSPDSQYLAWHREDRDFNSDIWVTRVAEGATESHNVSRHPDDDVNPRWSEDGRMLAFASERHDEEFDVYVVFLDRDLEALTPAELSDYFDARKKAAKARKPLPLPGEEPKKGDDAKKAKEARPEKPVELELEDAYLRVRRVTSARGNEVALELTPAGDRIVYSTGTELHVVGWDGKDDKRLRGAASIQHLSLDGETVVHVAGGRAGTVKTGGGGDQTHGIAARLELDWGAFQEQRYAEAMRHLGEVFYHPEMKGLDWSAVTRDYLALARRARTADEFDDVANRQLGELNASHLGMRSPSPDDAPKGVPNGRLGIDVVPDEVHPGGWRVTRVLRGGPAEAGSMWLTVRDVITAVDGVPCTPGTGLLQRLRAKIGEEVLLTIRRPREAEEPQQIDLLLRAISDGAESQLRYAEWTRRNAEQVHEWSDGRLGYLHIRAMSGGSLRDFERDLYAAAEGRDGLIVDVRNNGGGSTADLVLASIMVRPHAYTVPRGADPRVTDGYPQDRLFIQRYTRPMSMLCNEKSFSNAEIVSHAFKTLGRGTLVGEQTYGGVISTGGYALRDGTWIRTPFRGWFLPDGTDMENHGALPDLHVPQTPEAESRGDDEQLRAAVEELVGRLPTR